MKNSLTIALLTLALVPALASAQGPTVEVIIDGQQQPPPPEPEREPFLEDDDGRVVGGYQAYGNGFRLSQLSFQFDEGSEIAGVNGLGLQVPDRVNTGGFGFGFGYRPFPWLRLPEIRFRLGGGDAQTEWAPMGGGSGLEARADRVLVGAVDLVIGFELPLRKVTPFLRGYATAGFASVRADVRHAELGNLGTERAVDGWVGAGVEAGFNIMFHEHMGLTIAYRHGLYGPETSGAFIGLAILGND